MYVMQLNLQLETDVCVDAEYACLRTEAVVGIPKDVDVAEAAPLLCAGVTVFNSIRNMNIIQGDTVVIQGLGGLGHLALQYSRKMGYRTVAVSSSDAKKDFATRLGANEYIDTSKQDPAEAIQKLGGAALVVITAPNPKRKLCDELELFWLMASSYGPHGKGMPCWRKGSDSGSGGRGPV
jgi:D-arabinose 1-dehydrogenase-like Zn-dependent alcohol dehydrogenase